MKLKSFSREKLEKSQRYFSSLLDKKQQWTRSYYPCIFEADISMASRGEPWNVSLKRYLHSRPELSDVIEFISETQKCYFYKELNMSEGEISLIEYDSLLKNLKEISPPKYHGAKAITSTILERMQSLRPPLQRAKKQLLLRLISNLKEIFIQELFITNWRNSEKRSLERCKGFGAAAWKWCWKMSWILLSPNRE